MSKLILKSFIISMLIIPAVFAEDDTLSPFNLQGDDLKSPKPDAEEKFFATRAPMEVTLRRYFGVNMGVSFATLKPTITATNSNNVSSTQALSPNTPALSYDANLYGGAGTNFDHFYVGAELSGGGNTLKKNLVTTSYNTADNANATITFKQPLSFGLDFIPGYITSQKDFLFYGRIGIGTSLFNIRINRESDSSINKFLIGLRAGLGMEYFMSDSFSVRLDYIFSNYGDVNQTYKSNVNATTYSYKVSSPHTQQINLGLTVNF